MQSYDERVKKIAEYAVDPLFDNVCIDGNLQHTFYGIGIEHCVVLKEWLHWMTLNDILADYMIACVYDTLGGEFILLVDKSPVKTILVEAMAYKIRRFVQKSFDGLVQVGGKYDDSDFNFPIETGACYFTRGMLIPNSRMKCKEPFIRSRNGMVQLRSKLQVVGVYLRNRNINKSRARRWTVKELPLSPDFVNAIVDYTDNLIMCYKPNRQTTEDTNTKCACLFCI